MLTRTRQIIHQTLITILPDQFLGTPSAGAYVRKEQADNQNALGRLIMPGRVAGQEQNLARFRNFQKSTMSKNAGHYFHRNFIQFI